MRVTLATFAGFVGLAATAVQAAPSVTAKKSGDEPGAAPPIVLVRDDCGHGWHRTGWRDQWGRWHWGDCVPNGNPHPGWGARWDYPYPVWRGPSVSER
jgi:hypothetical protein